MFIFADETPEVRRKKTFDRLKTKAERDLKSVSVSSEGVLSVDGVEVFCLHRGFLRSVPQAGSIIL